MAAQPSVTAADSNVPPLIVIVGPTASGKSDLAMQAAKQFDGEIICADSRTIYKGLDIGTAKPTAQDREAVPHHLLDVVGPNETFSAADFKQQAQAAIAQIHQRHKLPIMVGGTGLYVDSILFDYEFGSKADVQKRAKLQAMSILELQDYCRQNNIEIPENSKNKRHLIRAIELGGLKKPQRSILRSHTIVVGIATSNDLLEARIIKRAEHMLQAGILHEVQWAGQEYGWDSEAMSGNIFRIMRRHLDGEITLHRALEEFVRRDLQLAKRQRTWFKRNLHIRWSHNPEELLLAVRDFAADFRITPIDTA